MDSLICIPLLDLSGLVWAAVSSRVLVALFCFGFPGFFFCLGTSYLWLMYAASLFFPNWLMSWHDFIQKRFWDRGCMGVMGGLMEGMGRRYWRFWWLSVCTLYPQRPSIKTKKFMNESYVLCFLFCVLILLIASRLFFCFLSSSAITCKSRRHKFENSPIGIIYPMSHRPKPLKTSGLSKAEDMSLLWM